MLQVRKSSITCVSALVPASLLHLLSMASFLQFCFFWSCSLCFPHPPAVPQVAVLSSYMMGSRGQAHHMHVYVSRVAKSKVVLFLNNTKIVVRLKFDVLFLVPEF